MKQKADFVHELHMEFLASRNALTRFENSDGSGKDARKELEDTMKRVCKELAEKREALLKEIK